VRRIPDHGSAGLITGVADQLRIEDARAWTSGGIRREDGDHWPDPSGIGGLAQMGDAFGRDLVRIAHLPPIPDPQRTPVQAADAARAVPPRDAGGEGEFRGSMPVGPVRLHLAADLSHPVSESTRGRVLVMEQPDEALSCR
jgi:hypothetical protein